MKLQTKNVINDMRANGKSPSVIASTLGISINTIKSYIRRNMLTAEIDCCLQCGKKVIQQNGRKQKKFCSDKCRSNYWNHQYRKEKGDDH